MATNGCNILNATSVENILNIISRVHKNIHDTATGWWEGVKTGKDSEGVVTLSDTPAQDNLGGKGSRGWVARQATWCSYEITTTESVYKNRYI